MFLQEQLALERGVALETIFHSDDFTLTADTGIVVDLTLAIGFHCIYFQIAKSQRALIKFSGHNDCH